MALMAVNNLNEQGKDYRSQHRWSWQAYQSTPQGEREPIMLTERSTG